MNAPLPVHRLRESAEPNLAFRLPAGMLTLEDFCDWIESDDAPERTHFAYLDGHIEVDMSPEDVAAHNRVKRVVYRLLESLIQDELGELLTDGAYYVAPQAGVANGPDAMFVSWKSLESGRVFYQPSKRHPDSQTQVQGKPDLVVEVVSNSSVYKDTVRLPKAYYLAGVGEYWIIDARGPKPSFQILIRGKRKFKVRQPDAQGYVRSDGFAQAFRLVRYKNRMNHVAFRMEPKP